MSKTTKALEKMRNNPKDWVIEDLERLAKHYGDLTISQITRDPEQK